MINYLSATGFRAKIRLAAYVVGMTALLSATVAANAAGQARDYVHPAVRRSHFQQFAEPLELTREQRVIAQMFFNDYFEALQDLTERTDDRAEKAGRSTIDAALRGKASVDYDRLQQMRADVLSAYRVALPEAYELLTQLLDDTYHLLNKDQEPAFTPAARTLRRQVLLHPYQSDEYDPSYAGDGVDINQLIETARRDEGELADLPSGALSEVRETYAMRLDAWLRSVEPQRRVAEMNRRIAAIKDDADARREHESSLLTTWRELYELNESTADEVAKIIREQLGERAAVAWRSRFYQASYPWLFGQRTPDRQHEWLARQSLTSQQWSNVEQRYTAYVHARQSLRQKTVDLMLKARIEHGVIVHPRMSSSELNSDATREIYEQLVRNSGELQTLHDQAADRIASVLDPAMRRRMNVEM